MTLPSVAQITVTGAIPSSATQGTNNLNVTITGNGFNKGAKAAFFVSGTTNNGGVTVNSTSYSNSSTLTANISIASQADISNYDVQITNSNGRTGVGSEAFAVVQGPVTSYIYDSATDNSGSTTDYTLQSDGIGVAPSGSMFAGAATYWNNDGNVSSTLPNDWYLQLQNQTYRTMRLTFVGADSSSSDKSALNGTYNAKIATRCFDKSGNWVSIPSVLNTPGASDNMCSMRIVNWFNNGTQYLFVMSPEYSGSGWSTVTCVSTGPFGCGSWTIVPTPANLLPNPNQANVGNLYIVKKGSGALTLVGHYVLTFKVGLTQP
jgi:hypothetical protein